MTIEKDKPEFNVGTNIKNNSFNTKEANSFVQSIVQAFQQVWHLLEAKRLVKTKDKRKELDLILNDEQHSGRYSDIAEKYKYLK